MKSTELLRAAAEALDDGRDPLTLPFLSENEVTADQCFALANQLALGARMVAKALSQPRSDCGTAMFMLIAEETP